MDKNTILFLCPSAQNGEIKDLCQNNPIHLEGSVTQGTMSQLGSSSIYIPSGSYIRISKSETGLRLPEGDFTIDWWQYAETAGCIFLSEYTSDTWGGLSIGCSGTQFYVSTSATANNNDIFSIENAMQMDTSAWNHFALVRFGSVYTIYKNGISCWTGTNNLTIANDSYDMVIGTNRSGDPRYYQGYIDAFRISNTARWIANFTPPSTVQEFLNPTTRSSTSIDLSLNDIHTDTIIKGDILCCPYSGNSKSFTLPPGKYKLESWGAQGGTGGTRNITSSNGTATEYLTTSTIGSYFTTSNSSYYFAGSSSTWTSNNAGISPSTAQTTWTASAAISGTVYYTYSSEANYDKFTLTVGGTTVCSAVSGATTSGSYAFSLSSGQTIVAKYAKDGSVNKNDDKCTIRIARNYSKVTYTIGSTVTTYDGGMGGYSTGVLTLKEDTLLFLYVGGQPSDCTTSTTAGVTAAGFNGGGAGCNRYYHATYTHGAGGGGASDIRVGQDSLYSRIIVAGGGGGAAGESDLSKFGGGESGNSSISEYGASQTSAGTNGSFGQGASASISNATGADYGSGGGGGGWYGGGACSSSSFSTNYRAYNGGGSGYVYTLLTSGSYPEGCLLNEKYYLSKADTVAGNVEFLAPDGTSETGHAGNGYIRITVLSIGVGPDVYIKRSDQVQQVEYIESSGTQYIDTGYKPNNTTRVVMDVWPSVAGTYTYFGGRDANTTATFTMWAINQTTVRSDFYTSTSNSLTVDTMLVRSTIDKNRNICTFNGTKITSPDGTFQSNYNLCLLAVNSGGAVDSRMLTAKLYSCQIYDNDVLIRDYVPCLCENGTYGLYDKVNETIVRNSGTGEFAGSSTIVGTFNIPAEWKKAASVRFKIPEKHETLSELQYFTSNGNIYFDTGMKADQNTAIEVGFSTTNEKCALIGSDTAWESSGFGIFCLIAEYGNSSCSSYNKYDGTYHVIKNDRGNIYIDDSLYGTVQSDDFTTLGNLYICANNRSGEAQEIFSGNFYYCKIWSNDILVRNYSACMFSDGTIALYDSVEKGVLYPIGTGSLNSGDISSSFQLTIPSSWKEISSLYIKSSGSWAKSGG